MSGEQPDIAANYRHKETALDLSVPRGEMYNRASDSSSDYPAVLRRSNSMPTGYQAPYQRNVDQRPRYYTESDPTPSFVHARPVSSDQREQGSPSMSGEGQEYYDRSEIPVYDSSILPKKRKNLWRPYDSRVLAAELETDSSSDSSASSDQDLNISTPPTDPVKKRKMDMLKYAQLQELHEANRINNAYDSPHGQISAAYGDAGDKCASTGNNWNWEYTPNTDQRGMGGGYPESHDKLISGMKKRDIFGWSLKLMKPPNVGDDTGECESGKDSGGVRLDGEKTYFELQTVKNTATNLDHPPKTISRVRSSPANLDTQPKSLPEFRNTQTQREACNTPQTNVQVSSRASHDINKEMDNADSQIIVPVNEEYSPGKDNVEEQTGSKTKIFIHGKDNVVQMFDESENTKPKSAAQKGISLIDLIEEIEADAIMKERESLENKKNIANGVAALLKQCDHVKLQALDFLMSNVLLQERGQSSTTKNACVQKMLRGDKIGSVSMLDVVEMQVEIGLR